MTVVAEGAGGTVLRGGVVHDPLSGVVGVRDLRIEDGIVSRSRATVSSTSPG